MSIYFILGHENDETCVQYMYNIFGELWMTVMGT